MRTFLPKNSPTAWLLTGLVTVQIACAAMVATAHAEKSPDTGLTLAALQLRPSPGITADSVYGDGGRATATSESPIAGLPPLDATPRAAALPAGPDIFGSVAVRMSPLAISTRWKTVIAEDAARFFTGPCPVSKAICRAEDWPRWSSAYRDAKTRSGHARLAFVNERINALVRYTSDHSLYGRVDHWATLSETVQNGAGDCEDYAIAKMWMLNALGVPLNDMQVVALRDRRRGLDHAVLAVEMDGRTWILDNVTDTVFEDRRIAHYQPVFSVGANGSWVHGFRRETDRISALRPSQPLNVE